MVGGVHHNLELCVLIHNGTLLTFEITPCVVPGDKLGSDVGEKPPTPESGMVIRPA